MYSPIDFSKMAEMLIKDLNDDRLGRSVPEVARMYLSQAYNLGVNDSWWIAQDKDESWIASQEEKQETTRAYNIYENWKAL